MGEVEKMPLDWHQAPADECQIAKAPAVRDGLHLYKRVVHPDAHQELHIIAEMRNDDYALSYGFKSSYNEMYKCGWPFKHFGVVGLGTKKILHYDDDDEEDMQPDKATCIDLDTFRYMFHEINVETTITGLLEAAAEICEEWNDTYGGSKLLRQRAAINRVLPVRNVAISIGSKTRPAVKTTELFWQVSSYETVLHKQSDKNAKLVPQDLHVQLKAWKGPSDHQSPKVISGCGFYAPLFLFIKFARSDEVRHMCAEGDEFLNKLRVESHPRFCFYKGLSVPPAVQEKILGPGISCKRVYGESVVPPVALKRKPDVASKPKAAKRPARAAKASPAAVADPDYEDLGFEDGGEE